MCFCVIAIETKLSFLLFCFEGGLGKVEAGETQKHNLKNMFSSNTKFFLANLFIN